MPQEDLERIQQISQAQLEGQDVSAEDIDFLFEMLRWGDIQTLCFAAVVLSQFPKPVIMKLVEAFPDYPAPIQKAVIPILTAMEFNEPYFALFRYLYHVRDPEIAELILRALSKTEYIIFPILMLFLSEENPAYRQKMKHLLVMMGFERLRPYLQLLPELPHEALFREVFGDEKVGSLK